MINFKLTSAVDISNPISHDLNLTNGSLTLTGGDATTFSEGVAQNIKQRIQLFRGEWFLDTREGVPWFQEIFVKAPNLAAIKTIFRQVIAGTDGVQSVTSMSVSLSAERLLSLEFEALLTDGKTLRSGDFAPFLVSL